MRALLKTTAKNIKQKKPKKTLKKKKVWNNKSITKSEQSRGVVYIGNLPHGLYEEGLRKYLSQYGKLSRLRVARSIKTGNPMGFAYAEFLYKEVADIVAKTCHQEMAFNKILKCYVIPPEKTRGKFNIITKKEGPKNPVETTRSTAQRSRRLKAKLKKYLSTNPELAPFLPTTEVKDTTKKVIMEIDGSDSEIEIKTPPNVVKKLKRKTVTSKKACDPFASTVKKSSKALPIENLSSNNLKEEFTKVELKEEKTTKRLKKKTLIQDPSLKIKTKKSLAESVKENKTTKRLKKKTAIEDPSLKMRKLKKVPSK